MLANVDQSRGVIPSVITAARQEKHNNLHLHKYAVNKQNVSSSALSKSCPHLQVRWLSSHWWSCWGEGHSSHPCSFHSSSEMCRYPPPAYYIYPHCSPLETPCYTDTHRQESCNNIISRQIGCCYFFFSSRWLWHGVFKPYNGQGQVHRRLEAKSCGKEIVCWVTNVNVYQLQWRTPKV